MNEAEDRVVTPPRWWEYHQLPPGEPYDWGGAARGDDPDDNIDFHLDLGCGRLKKGRLGIDHMADEGVDLVMDLDDLHVAGYGDRAWELATERDIMNCDIDIDSGDSGNPARGLMLVDGRMPFPADSIESIISHHCLEHLDRGFIRLMDECHRILKPGGIFRVIVPLFPSHTAISDPDHRRYFTPETFNAFCGDGEGNSWMESFSTPYSSARFLQTNTDHTPRDLDPRVWWTKEDARELRVTLTKQDIKR